MKYITASLMLMLLVGCGLPMTTKPLGERWKKADVVKLDGWWYMLDEGQKEEISIDFEPFKMQARKGGQGEAWGGGIRFENEEVGFAGESTLWTFTHLGKHDFVFWREDKQRDESESNRQGGFFFSLIQSIEGDTIKVAFPRQEAFVDLVKQGKLSGEIKDPEPENSRWAWITSDADVFVKAIEEKGLDKCFHMDHSITMKRVTVPTLKK